MGKRKYDASESKSVKRVRNATSVEVDDAISQEPRPHGGSDGEEPSQHAPRTFDLKHFRKELANKQGQTIVLGQFLQVCLNPDNDVDYLLEYLRSGGNSHEILRQVTHDSKKNLSLATPAFHLFHLIILKVQSSLPHLISITEEACRYFLNTFMSTVEIMLSESSAPRHRKIILKLLTSMVTLNSDLGVEILNQAPLSPKNLQHIVDKCNYKEKDNVRTCFVHFMTSFILEGHLPLIKALLEKQGLLGLVIPGLINDDADAVLMFLKVLKDNVIDNTLVSKTLKLKMFSQQVLHNLFKVFLWKGPTEISFEHKVEFRKEILSTLSDILLTLFTNHKIGLYFIDNTLGMSDANKNPNLYKALLSLKRPWENEQECDVILQIVYKCPDLHRAIIHVVEQSFEPQNSPIWERAMAFLFKLIDKLKPEDMVPRMTYLSSSQIANFVRFVTLPVPLLKCLQSGIGKDHHTISIYCVRLLSKMLYTLRRYMQIMDGQNSTTAILDLRNRLEYFLPKHMPTPGGLVELIDQVISSAEKPDGSKDYSLPKISDTDALICIMDLLLLFNDIHPTFFENIEGSLDVKKILNYSLTHEGNSALLKFKVVSLWVTLDSFAVSLKNPMFKELFVIMLDVFMSEDDNARFEAMDILTMFFKNTAIFEADEDEIHLILYTLRYSKVPASVIGDIIVYILENIHELSEYVKSQLVNFQISDENNAYSLEKLFEDLSENRKSNENVFIEYKMPSPFIVGCMKYLQINKSLKKNLKPFMSLYVVNLLHSNYSPELTEVLIGDCKLEATNYVANWKRAPVSLTESITGSDPILMNISKAVIDDENVCASDIFPFLQKSSMEDGDIEINGTTYKLKLTKDIESSELFIWTKYLIFCTIKLSELSQITFEKHKKITEYFHCLITIGKKHHNMSICRAIILNLFKNPHMLKLFKPVDQGGDEASVLATKFILNVITHQNDIMSYLDKKQKVLKLYQQKNYNEIKEAFVKIKEIKNFNSEYTISVLETVGLVQEDDLQMLKLVFGADITSCSKDNKEPSLVLELLRYLLDKYAKSPTVDLQQQMLRKSMILYTRLLTSTEVSVDLTKLESSLAQYFNNKPHQVNKISEDLFGKFFQANTIRKTTSHLACVLLKYNAKFCNVFKAHVAKPEIMSRRELTLPLGSAILVHTSFLANNRQSLMDIYDEYKSNISKMLEKPHKAGRVYLSNSNFIKKLVQECMDVEDCEKLFSKSYKFESAEPAHIDVFHGVFMKLCASGTATREHLTNYLLSALHSLTITPGDEGGSRAASQISARIYEALRASEADPGLRRPSDGPCEQFERATASVTWQTFERWAVERALGADDAGAARLLARAARALLPADHAARASPLRLAAARPGFARALAGPRRARLAALAALASPPAALAPTLLAAYRGTRAPADRALLAALRRCPPPARAAAALDALRADTAERTAAHFPADAELRYEYAEDTDAGADTDADADADDEVYEPAWALGALSAALGAGGGARARAVWRRGLLALPLAALAARCPRLRAAAALVLRRFGDRLEEDARRGGEAALLCEALRLVRRSARPAPGAPRLPRAGALYLARALRAAAAPAHPLYRPLHRFLRARRAMPPAAPPDWRALLRDAEPAAPARRLWLLELLRDAARADPAVLLHEPALAAVAEYAAAAPAPPAHAAVVAHALAQAARAGAAPALLHGRGLAPWLRRAARVRRAPAVAVRAAAAAAPSRALARAAVEALRGAPAEEAAAALAALPALPRRTARAALAAALGAARGPARATLLRALGAGRAALAEAAPVVAEAERDPRFREMLSFVRAHLRRSTASDAGTCTYE